MSDSRSFLFGPGTAYAQISTYTDGTAPAVLQTRKIDVMQDFSLDISMKTAKLMGQLIFPVAVGIGEGDVKGKIKMGRIYSGLVNDIALGNNPATYQTTGQTLVADANDGPSGGAYVVAAAKSVGGVTAAITSGATALTLSGTITGLAAGMLLKIAGAGAAAADLYVYLVSGATTSWVVSAAAGTTVTTAAVTTYPSVTVAQAATFAADQGVALASSGAFYTALLPAGSAAGTAAPVAGVSYVSGGATGVYSFATADAAVKVLIAYTYTVTTGIADADSTAPAASAYVVTMFYK